MPESGAGLVTRGKRIAIVYRNLTSLSGTPNTIFSHARILSRLGYRVDLVTEKVDRMRIDGGRINIVRIPRLPLLKPYRLSWFSRRAGRLVRTGYDFVAGHGHNTVHDVISLHNCERLCHLKVTGREMTRANPLARLQDRIFTEQRFTFCIANSRLMRDELISRYGVPADRIRVVYPGYDPARFNPDAREKHRSAMRGQLGVEPGQILIGVITSGAFEIRGLDLAIDAFAALPAPIRDKARMIVIGRASSIDRYTAQIAEHGLGPQITFLPATREVEQYYHALDIYLHPARLETFGQSVQEAMACGVPVVTNRHVGAVELLPEAAYARLPRVSTVPVLVAQLEALIKDEEARRAWGDLGREAVEHNTLQSNCERTLAVYREAGL